MNRERLHALPLLLAATLICAGCTSDQDGPSVTNPGQPSPPAVDSPPASPLPGPKLPTGADPVTLDPADFSADITNPYWPMKPGTRWIYRGVEEGESPQHIVIVATTSTKKLANGITVWYMGEQTAEFENGKVVSRAGSWEAGKDGAMPGIMIPAQPQVGQRYRQEYKKGDAEDNGEVLAMNNLVEVKAGQYRRTLVTMDTSTIEPDVVEFKFYAPNVGPLLALDIAGGAAREELVKIEKAAPQAGTGPIGQPKS
jgi:hypothetical protein